MNLRPWSTFLKSYPLGFFAGTTDFSGDLAVDVSDSFGLVPIYDLWSKYNTTFITNITANPYKINVKIPQPRI